MAIVFVLREQGSPQKNVAGIDDNLYLHASMFGVLAAIPYSIVISAQKVIKQNILFAVVLCWRYH